MSIEKEVLENAFEQHGWKTYAYVIQAAYNPDASVFLKPFINVLPRNYTEVATKMHRFIVENQVDLLALEQNLKSTLLDTLLTFDDPELVGEFHQHSHQFSSLDAFKILHTLLAGRTHSVFRNGVARSIFKLPSRNLLDIVAALDNIIIEKNLSSQRVKVIFTIYIEFVIFQFIYLKEYNY